MPEGGSLREERLSKVLESRHRQWWLKLKQKILMILSFENIFFERVVGDTTETEMSHHEETRDSHFPTQLESWINHKL